MRHSRPFAVLSVVAAGLFGVSSGSDITSAQTTEPRVIDVVAMRYEFVPSTIEVAQGERVRLVVTSGDGFHGLGIEQFDVSKEIARGDTVTIEFTPDVAGEFPILCTEYCGDGDAGTAHRESAGSGARHRQRDRLIPTSSFSVKERQMHFRLWTVSVLAAGLAAMSACGGSGGDTSSSPTAPSSPAPAAPTTITITSRNGAQSFSPNPATVGGQLVVFRNADTDVHRVRLNDGSIDTGDIAPGATSAAVTMPVIGTNYHCSIHPDMIGAVFPASGGEPPACTDYCDD